MHWSSKWSLSLRFHHQNPVCTSPAHHTCYMLRPPHLDFITRMIFGEEYRSPSSSLCRFLHSPITSSLLCPNILLNILFSNTLSLRSPLNVSDRVSHPYKTTGKIIVLCIYNRRSQWRRTYWDFGFESRLWYGCLSLVSVVCRQVEVSASD